MKKHLEFHNDMIFSVKLFDLNQHNLPPKNVSEWTFSYLCTLYIYKILDFKKCEVVKTGNSHGHFVKL